MRSRPGSIRHPDGAKHRPHVKRQMKGPSASPTTGTASSARRTQTTTAGRNGFSCNSSEGSGLCSRSPGQLVSGTGTVLANEEIVDGKSEVGGFDVVGKPMRQWVLKITAYADRLLDDLSLVDGRRARWKCRKTGSAGRSALKSNSASPESRPIRIFTTKPDTLFGATYMVLAPELRSWRS